MPKKEKADFVLHVRIKPNKNHTFRLRCLKAECLSDESIKIKRDDINSDPVPHQVNEIINSIVAFARRGSIPVKFSFAVAYVRLHDDLFIAYDTCRHSASADGLSQVVFPPRYLREGRGVPTTKSTPATGILQGLNALFGNQEFPSDYAWCDTSAVIVQDVVIRGFSMKEGEDFVNCIDFAQHITVKRFPLGEFFSCLPLPGFADAHGGKDGDPFPEQVFCVAGYTDGAWEADEIAVQNLDNLRKAFESDEPVVRVHGPTGKSAFAHALHRGFLRTGDFVQIDVLRYPEWESLEALLFGHLEARGLPGSLVSRARRGTIFIDNTDWLDAITRNRLLAAIEARWHLLRRGGEHRLVEFPDTNWILGHSTRASDGGDDRNHAAVSFESFLANPLEALPEGNSSQPAADPETAARSYLHALLFYGAYRKRFVSNRDAALPSNPYLEPPKWQFQRPGEEPVIRGYAQARAYAELHWRTLTAPR